MALDGLNLVPNLLHVPIMNLIQIGLKLPEGTFGVGGHGLTGGFQQIHIELEIGGDKKHTELFGILRARIGIDGQDGVTSAHSSSLPVVVRSR